jgi:glycogen(starch) synthase
MRFLMVYSQKYPHIGGLSTHMDLMGKGLRELGHEVDYLSLSSLPKTVQLGLFRGPMSVLNKLCKGLGEVYFLYASRVIFALALMKRLRNGRYDAIDTHHVSSCISARMAVGRRNIPVILTVHTYYTSEMESVGVFRKGSRCSEIGRRNERRAYESAAHIIAVDNRLMNHVLSFGIPPGNVDVVLNPVDTSTFTPRAKSDEALKAFNIPKGSTVVLCPRRLAEKNGVLVPVLAATHLRDRVRDILFVYAGGGELRAQVEELISENRLAEHFLMLGFVDHSLMHSLYNLADIVVIPSITSGEMQEASSISALEAMASGVPVIASNIGGLREIVRDGVDGMLVEENDPEALAAAIIRLISDKVLYKAMASSAVDHARTAFSYVSRAGLLVRMVEKKGPQ